MAEEIKQPAAAETTASQQEKIEIPAKFKTLIETIEKMSVLELSDFVKALEEKFGVSAQVMVAQAPTNGAQAASAESSGEPKEEKTEEAEEQKSEEAPKE